MQFFSHQFKFEIIFYVKEFMDWKIFLLRITFFSTKITINVTNQYWQQSVVRENNVKRNDTRAQVISKRLNNNGQTITVSNNSN